MELLKINPKRSLFLQGSQNENDFDQLISKLLEMNKEEGDIWLIINCIGGSTAGARKLHSCLIMNPNPVYGLIVGNCFSAASIALQGCYKRYATENSQFHIHNPFWPIEIIIEHNSTLASFEERIENSLSTLKKTKKAVENIFQQRTSLEISQIQKIMDEDKIIPLENALRLGFIDEIVKTESRK